MALSDLTDDDQFDLVRLLRETIEADLHRRSRRTTRLKSILAKLEPAPLATLTLALAKKRGKER